MLKTLKRFKYSIILFILLLALLRIYICSLSSEESVVTAQFNIAILKENGFPSVGTPGSLTPEWIYNNLSKTYSVTYLDSERLSDKRYLNADNFDLLILPYGEAFPYKAYQQIKEFLYEGGGLLNIAGRPFWVPIVEKDGIWQRLNVKDPFKEFLAPLGIKYYETSDNKNIGLSVTTSHGFSPLQPTHGNVFPYRLPCRNFYSLETIKGKNDDYPLIFIKSWQNPYMKESKKIPNKWCLIGIKEEDHPLGPRNSSASQALSRIMQALSFPVIIYGLETDLSAYYPGEKVEVSLKIMNNGKLKAINTVEFEFLNQEDKVIYKAAKQIELKPQQEIVLKERWQPNEFSSCFYKVRAALKKDEMTLDKEENGFVMINKGLLKSGPSIQIEEKGFIIDGKKSPILGINYYESKDGELMWVRPNILRIREDFKNMRKLGINFVRIHYHHSKWFRDYFSRVVNENPPQYLQVADTTALPSERSLRILDAIIQLAQEEKLIFCIDIFSLVPEEMGDPIGWLGLKERILDKEKVAVQKKFAYVLANRYKDVPGITWDLWNEPRLDKKGLELLRTWANEIKKEFRENGDTHPITIGDDLSLYLLDTLDYACIHTYEPGEFKPMQAFIKPVIFQEVWNTAGCSLDDEIRQSEELKKDFNAFLKTETAGFVPWQWTRQARLWDNASEAEEWDDMLGVCTHDDGTLKIAGKRYQALIELLETDSNKLK